MLRGENIDRLILILVAGFAVALSLVQYAHPGEPVAAFTLTIIMHVGVLGLMVFATYAVLRNRDIGLHGPYVVIGAFGVLAILPMLAGLGEAVLPEVIARKAAARDYAAFFLLSAEGSLVFGQKALLQAIPEGAAVFRIYVQMVTLAVPVCLGLSAVAAALHHAGRPPQQKR